MVDHQIFALLAQGAAQENPSMQLWTLILPMIVLFYFVVWLPERRKAKEQKGMLANLKKNDRVLTIGGIVGVITNVQRDADRVTIKVDEATGATIKVTVSAISRVLAEETASAST